MYRHGGFIGSGKASLQRSIDEVGCGFDVKAANNTQAEFVTPEMTQWYTSAKMKGLNGKVAWKVRIFKLRTSSNSSGFAQVHKCYVTFFNFADVIGLDSRRGSK